jgi:hypothetical protein
MILINETETKKVYFYLTPTIPNPYYLFRFISNDTGEETLMISENNSTVGHFQSFTFSSGGTQSLLGGFSVIPGTYDYEVYQTPVNSLTIGSASLPPLEIGLMTVKQSPTASNFIWKEEVVNNWVYYNPQTPTPPGLTGV